MLNNKKPRVAWCVRSAVLMTVSLLFPSTSLHAAQSLTLLTWEEYLSEAVIERWQAETGVEIQQIFFDSGDKRDEILAKPDHQIDIALTELISSSRFGARKLLEPIEQARLPALRHVARRWRDSCGRYAVPYLWGTLGIAYRSDRIEQAPRSWADLLKPARPDEPHIVMMEDHEDILASPLILLGHSINTSDLDQLKAAFELLRSQSEAVLTYELSLIHI